MRRIGLAASEEKSFENVDDRRTTDTSIYYKLTFEPSAQVSLNSKKPHKGLPKGHKTD